MRNIYSSRLIKLETRFEQRGTYSDAMFISGASKTISSGIFFFKSIIRNVLKTASNSDLNESLEL